MGDTGSVERRDDAGDGGTAPPDDAGDIDAADGGAPRWAASVPAQDAAPAARRLGEVEVASSVVRSGDLAGARGVFLAGRPGLRACYERALALDPSARGEMMISVGVRNDGSVGDVAVGRSPLPSGTTGCFSRTIAALRFPAAESGSRVDMKLLLTPRR
jgi:hypothetical protein